MKEIKTNINELAMEHYHRMRAKGFGDRVVEKAAELMSVVTELAEATEACRMAKYADLEEYYNLQEEECLSRKEAFERCVKDTFEDEIADAMLRLLYIVGRYEIDIDTHIREKMRYNAERPRLHGKLF